MLARVSKVICSALLLLVPVHALEVFASLPAVVQSRSAPKITIVFLARAPTHALSTTQLKAVALMNSSALVDPLEVAQDAVELKLTACLSVFSAIQMITSVISSVQAPSLRKF
jgi:hypothetical protein